MLKRKPTRRLDILVHPDREAFPYDDWVPSISRIVNAQNVVSQKSTLEDGVICVSALRGIRSRNDKKAYTRIGSWRGEARFNTERNNILGIRFLRIAGIEVGYPSLNENDLNAPFAIYDDMEGYHKAIRNPEEPLGGIELQLGLKVAEGLASDLDRLYPGFNIYQQLEDVGISFD